MPPGWPTGFVCPHGGGVSAREEANRPSLWGRRSCGKQTSLTSGTVTHGAKLPLRYWFWEAYLAATRSYGIAPPAPQQASPGMVNPDHKKLFNIVEVDEAYITFRSKHDPDVDSRGRSLVGKIAIAIAVVEFVAKNGGSRTRAVRICAQ